VLTSDHGERLGGFTASGSCRAFVTSAAVVQSARIPDRGAGALRHLRHSRSQDLHHLPRDRWRRRERAHDVGLTVSASCNTAPIARPLEGMCASVMAVTSCTTSRRIRSHDELGANSRGDRGGAKRSGALRSLAATRVPQRELSESRREQ
jgi:hypothetical protein